MQINLKHLPYPSVRQPLFARRGIVSTSQPLAAQAGLSMLQRGGNAVDTALASAITLTVVEPTSNGIGSDMFALIWVDGKLHGLNASGRAPAALTPEVVRKQGHDSMPSYGWMAVTVPGAPAGWRDLHARFGKLPFETLFEPAIEYAEKGYALPVVVQENWERAAQNYLSFSEPEFQGWGQTFAPNGRVPQVGEIWSSPGHARTLRLIAETKAEAFYRGIIAEEIVAFAQKTGGFFSLDDFAQHTSTWVEPITTSYRGYDVWEIPPNGQGITALIALNILEGFDLSSLPRDSERAYHLQIEAIKLAYADAHHYVADPEHVTVPTAQLLSKEYAAERRALIGERALLPQPGDPVRGGTVYMNAVDESGMMVSLIQSNFAGFGSGIVVPGTGVSLQNRGAGFKLEEGHLNMLAPRKRPYHTIIPAFLSRNGEAIGPFGVMGGHMQPQGHTQMVVNTVDYGMNPQASIDALRWYWDKGLEVQLEAGTSPEIANALRERGHQVSYAEGHGIFGRGQIIWRLPSGAYVAGSEWRADGYPVGF